MESVNKEVAYEVGYGRPPRHTQFPKGRSGNSKGRPKGVKNFTTVAEEALSEPVFITEKGRRRKISKMEAIFKQFCNKAALGDYRSGRLILDFIQKHQLKGGEGGKFTLMEFIKAIDGAEDGSKTN